MANHPNRSLNPDCRYIVMDAPGHHGTWIEVHSSHATLAEAMSAAGNRSGVIVSDDGGFHENHQPGSLIHQRFADAYRTHWSIGIAAARHDRRARAKRYREVEANAARYGRGSTQYAAAMERDWSEDER